MKLCTCCSSPVTAPRNVRAHVLPYMYQLYFECQHCTSTLAVTLWEAPEEDDLLLDGELRTVSNSLCDTRPEEAA